MPLDAPAGVGGVLPGALPQDFPKATELYNHHLMYIAPEVSLDESRTWVLGVDTTILSLTLIGSFFIIGRIQWNEYKGRGATTRMRFVESLIFTDVVMGIVGLIGCGMQLDHKYLQIDSPTCNGLGVMMVAVFWSQHLWTLLLALSTFMILVHPLHSLTSRIEKSWYWAWPVVWGISLAVGLIGLFVYGYGPAGGICFYQNNAGLYAELMQFLPRAIVFICIAILYGKLYRFLKRPDKIRTGFSDPSHSTDSSHRWFGVRSRSKWFGRGTKVEDGGAGAQSTASRRSAPGPIDLPMPPNADPPPSPSKLEPRIERGPFKTQRHSHRHAPSDVPPWERLELPAFQVDGERFGGYEVHDHRHWRDWNGFAGRKRNSNMLSVTSPITSPTKGVYEPTLPDTLHEGKVSPTASYFPLPPTNASSFGANTPPPVIVNRAPPSTSSESTIASPTSTAVEPSDGAGPHRRPSTFSQVSGSSEIDGLKLPSVPNSATTLNEVCELRRDSIPDGTIPFRRMSGLAVPGGLPAPRSRPSLVSIPSAAEVHQTASQRSIDRSSPLPMAGKDPEKGCVDYEDDDEEDDHGNDTWDLARMLKEEPPDADRNPFAIQTATSENVEYVPESLASYLNRKTALLMLWFPLGYVLLFSVSMVRLIYDFSGNPPIALRAISRWMMFGQGLLDAIIYGLVEWHTKRVVRRRVRKGTFASHNSGGSHHSGFGSAMRNLNPLRKHGHSHGNGNGNGHGSKRESHTGTGTGSALRDAGSPTVSFAEPERSILHRLDEQKQSETSGET